VNIGSRVIGDAGVAMLVVVPAEEANAEAAGVLHAAKPLGESGRYLSVLNLTIPKPGWPVGRLSVVRSMPSD